MQTFRCPTCQKPVYFDNLSCTCGQEMSFDPDAQIMQAGGKYCANRADIACNWQAENAKGLCRSCAMTETVPDLRTADNLPLWQTSEAAKRWMLAGVMRWGWFTPSDPGPRPVFRMLSEQTAGGAADVVMGHAAGLITINVTEASDTVLAQRQEQFGELYRTMLGHMRHETAHFLFTRLAGDWPFLNAFRALFGDERADYAAALQSHYSKPVDQPHPAHITQYASAHPHEDWAETIAHLLHLTDLLDSGAAAGMSWPDGPLPGYDAYAEPDTEALLRHAIALTIATNHVNRAVDLPDLYPFVLTAPVREKLGFAHAQMTKGAGALNPYAFA